MSRCLSEDALMRWSTGEAAAAECEHADGCIVCRRRALEWSRDIERLGAMLDGEPPRTVAARRRVAQLPAIAAAAVLLAAVAVLLRSSKPSSLTESESASAELSRYALEVSAAVFDPHPAPRPSAVGSGFERALDSGAPCTGRRLVDAVCNDYTSALYF